MVRRQLLKAADAVQLAVVLIVLAVPIAWTATREPSTQEHKTFRFRPLPAARLLRAYPRRSRWLMLRSKPDVLQLTPSFGKGQAPGGQGAAMPWIAAFRRLRQAGGVEPVTVQPSRSSPRQIGDFRSPQRPTVHVVVI